MKLEKDYAVIETAEETALFSDIRLKHEGNETPHAHPKHVLKAITPTESAQRVRWWHPDAPDDSCPETEKYNYIRHCQRDHNYQIGCVLANALTYGTVGELRELLTWAKGDCDEIRTHAGALDRQWFL